MFVGGFPWFFFRKSFAFFRVPARVFSVCLRTNPSTIGDRLTSVSIVPSAVMAWTIAILRHSSVLYCPFA